MKWAVCLFLPLSLLAACDSGSTEAIAVSAEPPAEVVISSNDFALVPCGASQDAACVLVFAGGKGLLFGAPAGLSNGISEDRLASLDSTFLFSLMPRDVEGLDEVRNRGWRAGRADALIVAGPEGVGDMITALNLAFEQPDALSYVEEGAPRGGFNAALLQAGVEVVSEAAAFDSGDLKVSGVSGPGSHLTYRIGYRDLAGNWHDLVLKPCSGPEPAAPNYDAEPRSVTVIACDGEDADLNWPIRDVIKITK
ncbi:hypothetical protein WNY37_06370 [Henriciella sp. AS95]|uniref:hypothetical protein n=1 Tax=Henriciella sp. AS95 TaxID=3135782 RepID=UPI00317EDAF2